MQEELRRCNYLGGLNSIRKFAAVAVSEQPHDLKNITSICALDASISVKVRACLSFFTELGFLKEENGYFTSTEEGNYLVSLDYEAFVSKLSESTLLYLVQNRLITSESIIYDHENNICRIKRSGFPLAVAVMRNLLLDAGALCENDPGIYDVSTTYEQLFEESVRKKRAAMSLEQLLEIHKKQELQGRLAEEFVVEFEKRRLLWCGNAEKVKQISDFDVSAGYDIISFNTEQSISYDRFIEVKSYSSTQSFFWSANEMKTAKELRGKYFLYLVNMELYQTKGYEPTIVQDPANVLLSSEDWMVETSALKITKV